MTKVNDLTKSLIPFEQDVCIVAVVELSQEFASHAELVAALGAKSYFAKPYHSWERGLNEHTNGLVRQYFPKGTDFSMLSNADVQRLGAGTSCGR